MEHFFTRIVLFLKDVLNDILNNKESRNLAIRILLIVGFIVFIANLCSSPSSPPSSPTHSYTDSRIDAYTTSKRIIEKVLKAPSTATFQSYDKSMISVSGDTYTVNGYVDAQNSFGAMLRSYYTVRLKGSAYNWTIESVVFDSEKIR